MKISDKDYGGRLFALAVLALSAVYISLIWNNNVWMDEAFSASLVNTGFSDVIKRSMEDTLPPLYNIYLWLMTTAFGYSVPVMKVTSVIPMILTLAVAAVVVRRRSGARCALLFMLLLTFMPLMLYFGIEIRMYSLGFFFATASGIYAYEAAKEPSRKNLMLFCIFCALSGYTHHFALVTSGFAFLYLLVYCLIYKRMKIKDWFFCVLGTLILYLPCFVVTIRQFMRVSGYFSMPEIDMHTFIQYALYPYTVGITAASVVCLLLAVAAVLLFVKDAAAKRKIDEDGLFMIFCFGTYYGVLVFGTLVCKVMSANIFVDRYLFFSTGLLWLAVANVLSKDRRVYYAALTAALITGICTYYVQFKAEYGNSAREEMEFFRANIGEGDVYFNIGGHEELQNCIPFYTYLDSATPDISFVSPLEDAIETSRARGTTLWISVLDGYSPSAQDMDILEKYGLSMEKAAEFDFDRYRCEFYKVR